LQKQTDSWPQQVYAAMMALGEELRKAREGAHMTQEQVAVAAGIDRPHLSLLENNHKSPTVDTLIRICLALGIPASKILARVERSEQA
jgi:transcriptional regulator with XRE-family HTH domain